MCSIEPAHGHTKLVAAKSGHHRVVEPCCAALQNLGELSQNPIARVVALIVIDALQAVEVDHRQTNRHLAITPLPHGVFEPLVERSTVREPGHRVGLREQFDFGHVIDRLESRAHLGSDC